MKRAKRTGGDVDGVVAIGPPCEWPRDPVLQWPDALEDVPKCGRPSVALGRYTDWGGTQRIAVCETHDKAAGKRASMSRGWATVPWQPEMVRGRDGRP